MCDDKVRVAVRVRPLNRRELDLDTQSVVQIQDNRTILQSIKDNRQDRYCSIYRTSSNAGQAQNQVYFMYIQDTNKDRIRFRYGTAGRKESGFIYKGQEAHSFRWRGPRVRCSRKICPSMPFEYPRPIRGRTSRHEYAYTKSRVFRGNGTFVDFKRVWRTNKKQRSV